MNIPQPRMRMFAGPNGSGKTTIKSGLEKSDDWFGLYINPDELELALKKKFLSTKNYGLKFSEIELKDYFKKSRLLSLNDLTDSADAISCRDGKISFHNVDVNSYHTSVLADFLRRIALKQGCSFSFETVMSSPDKIELLQLAQAQGFRTYLYYVATEDPLINISRVKLRVSQGGHDVPEDKIVSRYFRSIQLLPEAIRYSNRAFFFDTSGEKPLYFGTATEGRELFLESNSVPIWFSETRDQLDR